MAELHTRVVKMHDFFADEFQKGASADVALRVGWKAYTIDNIHFRAVFPDKFRPIVEIDSYDYIEDVFTKIVESGDNGLKGEFISSYIDIEYAISDYLHNLKGKEKEKWMAEYTQEYSEDL